MKQAANPGFDPRIADWLEGDPDMAPPVVLDTVLSAIPSIAQRRRFSISWPISRVVHSAMAAAVVVLVIALALGLWPRIAPVAGPRSSLSPTPTPTASPATIRPGDVGRNLEAGSYVVDGFAVPLSANLPEGWTAREFSRNNLEFRSTRADVIVLNVVLIVMDKVYHDPCNTTGGAKALGPSVDDLVAALSSLPGFEIGDVRDASIGGAPGKAMRISNSIDTTADNCSGETLPIGTYDKDGEATDVTMFGHESDLFWVVDVRGTRLLIAVNDHGPESRDTTEALLQLLISFTDASAAETSAGP